MKKEEKLRELEEKLYWLKGKQEKQDKRIEALEKIEHDARYAAAGVDEEDVLTDGAEGEYHPTATGKGEIKLKK